MKFEVTDRREEKKGLIFKKSAYVATTSIHLETDEFEALKALASEKEWKHFPLGTIRLNDKFTRDMTIDSFYLWAKKTGRFEKHITTSLPEEREAQIHEMQELAKAVKEIISTRMAALNTTDEDVSIEL